MSFQALPNGDAPMRPVQTYLPRERILPCKEIVKEGKLRVQAPLGARVLSFVCCAPNDGFSPQSGLVQRGVLYTAAWGSENHTTALQASEMHSPFGGWRHHLARWEACHWIRGSRGSPMNPVPLPPPQFGGAAKGKRLNGQARRLTSPHLEVLCRTSTVAL